MRIIISPAKKMKTDCDSLEFNQLPYFIDQSERLKNHLKTLDYSSLKSLWKCSDSIAILNQERLLKMDLQKNLTPAIIAFEGIQYQKMACGVLESQAYDYLEEHLRILSGFYGLLKPFDGLVPYRLEMQSKISMDGFPSLYEFWGDRLAKKLFSESPSILNLASKEYSRAITPYLNPEIKMVTCVFGEWKEGKIVEKGTLVKMARGEMVRFLAENQIKSFEGVKSFNSSGYAFNSSLSDENTFVFIQSSN